MVLTKFDFFYRRKISLNVKICSSLWSKFSGLMFRKKSPSLLFVFNKEKKLSIHSLFCQKFIAVWIGSDKNASKIQFIDGIGLNFSGRGRFLLEIPESDENYLKMTKLLKIHDGQKKKDLYIKSI